MTLFEDVTSVQATVKEFSSVSAKLKLVLKDRENRKTLLTFRAKTKYVDDVRQEFKRLLNTNNKNYRYPNEFQGYSEYSENPHRTIIYDRFERIFTEVRHRHDRDEIRIHLEYTNGGTDYIVIQGDRATETNFTDLFKSDEVNRLFLRGEK